MLLLAPVFLLVLLLPVPPLVIGAGNRKQQQERRRPPRIPSSSTLHRRPVWRPERRASLAADFEALKGVRVFWLLANLFTFWKLKHRHNFCAVLSTV